MLDATMRSQDVVNAFGKVDKAASEEDPFGMKNAVRQSTKLRQDQVIVSFIGNAKAARQASAGK